jgi:hypothetical protein
MNKHDPAMETHITKQFECGECDTQTFILMLIGKLCDRHSKLTKLNLDSELKNYTEEESKNHSIKVQLLENEIEDLNDDISYWLHRLS